MRLYLGLEQIEFSLALLFEDLLRLTFEPEIRQGDAEDEAEDKDDETGDGKVKVAAETDDLGGFCEIPIVEAGGDKGMGDAGGCEQGGGCDDIPAYVAFS
jgi:hypothetical protein